MDKQDDGLAKRNEADPAKESEITGAVESPFHSTQLSTGNDLTQVEQIESEVFFIRVIRATSGEYWAELQVSCGYSASGQQFNCYVQAYRALGNGEREGNVSFGLQVLGDIRELTGNAIQDGGWHNLTDHRSLSVNGADVMMVFKFMYDRSGVSDRELVGTLKVGFKSDMPSINAVPNFVTSTFNVTGGGAHNLALMVLDGGSGPIGSELVSAGNWTVPATVAENVVRQNVQAYQQYGNSYSARTNFFTTYRATITDPIAESQMGIGDVIKGIAAPGTEIKIVRDDNHWIELAGPVTVGASATWELSINKLSFYGRFPVVVQLRHPDVAILYTEAVSFIFMLLPVILLPQASTVQDSSFVLQGNNGLKGARLVVRLDLTNSVVGESNITQDNGQWSVSVSNLRPGPINLVAEQIFEGTPSGRSAARSFRIRPPKLEKPEVTFLPDTSLKFSGTGHFDQNLTTEIQFSASDGSLPLPPNVRVNAQGQWETAPVVWPLGSYDVRVMQKIADNASGWIESQLLEFKVHNDMPDITEASYTEDYLPVFSGKGYTGATVSLRFPDTTEAARSVGVVNGQWETPALETWGPTNKREVHITQHLGDHPSQRPFILYVTILPLAPGLDDPSEEGLKPVFRGTCLSGATVSIRFSDNTETHVATVAGATWTFQRQTSFEANIEHTVEVTQTILDLHSKPASKTFTVHRVMLQPLIVAPVSGAEVGYDVIIEGDNGMQGAMMQLHDSQMGGDLGDPLELFEEGKWSIKLSNLELRDYFLHAQQTLNGQESANSAEHMLKVVVPPPRFTTPIPGGKAPRTSKIIGTGRATARVDVWLEGATEPLLTAIEVNASGNWEAEVSLPVGNTTIWAFQTLVHNGSPQRSQPNERLRYKVVPAAPVIETPTADDHVGRRVVVSGFATPGDTVTVTLGSDQASAKVRENRTWSVTLEPGQDEGNHELEVVAACEGFASDSAKRTLQLATYLPTIEIPEPGRWVSNPVLFAGRGRQGVGVLVDPFNPDKTWVASIPVDSDWQSVSDHLLPLGGNWCRFKLQPSDSDPLGSDWVVSKRFEIE